MSTSINGTTGIDVSAVSSSAITADRTSTDGTIIDLQKSGTTVGSIGVLSNRLSIGTGDTGLFFNDQTDQVQPFNTSTNAARDAAIDLGTTDRRFKDLYLSGGVYLGGTGSSNLLQDYEEGSFTPVMRDTSDTGTIIGSTVTRATYTKIGRWVNCILDITRNDSASLTGNLFVTGLPFTGAAGKSLSSGAWFDGSSTDYIALVYKRTSDTVALFRDVVAPSSAPYVTSNEWQNGRPLITSILYEAA